MTWCLKYKDKMILFYQYKENLKQLFDHLYKQDEHLTLKKEKNDSILKYLCIIISHKKS